MTGICIGIGRYMTSIGKSIGRYMAISSARCSCLWLSASCSRNLCLYTVSQNCFCQKLVKCLPNLIIFCTQIAERIGLCEV